MKTDDLIAMLATGVEPVRPGVVGLRLHKALVAGVLGAFVVMLLGYGVRPDLAQAAWLPMFWVKLLFPLAVALPALVLMLRLGRPGVRLGRVGWALVVPWMALSLFALGALMNAPPGARLELVLGKTWLSCALNIAWVSVPSFVATFWVLRGMAPTRPAWAGASAGLLAACLGTLVYALHCPEMQAPFLAVWYVLGMLIPTAAGALLGPKLLRW